MNAKTRLLIARLGGHLDCADLSKLQQQLADLGFVSSIQTGLTLPGMAPRDTLLVVAEGAGRAEATGAAEAARACWADAPPSGAARH